MRNHEADKGNEKISAATKAEYGTGRIKALSSVIKKLLIPFLDRPGSSLLAVLLGIAAALFNLSRPILLGWAIGALRADPASNGWRIAVGLLVLSWLCTGLISYALERVSTAVEQHALLPILRARCSVRLGLEAQTRSAEMSECFSGLFRGVEALLTSGAQSWGERRLRQACEQAGSAERISSNRQEPM